MSDAGHLVSGSRVRWLCSILILALGSGCARYRSLAEFVEKNPDDFPSPYVSVSPPASTSALGGLPDPSTTDDRRAVLTTHRCFLASPTGSPTPVNEAGTDYRIHYRIGKDLAADFNVEVVSVGVDVKASQRFVLALDDVRVQSADLLPIPGGDCGTFDNPDEVFVIFTKQVVAVKVLL